MNEFILIGVPWILSGISIVQAWLAGSLHKKTWLIGLANQSLWLVWIVWSQTWGFLPLNIMLWITYTRNHYKWQKLEKIKKIEQEVENEIEGRCYTYGYEPSIVSEKVKDNLREHLLKIRGI